MTDLERRTLEMLAEAREDTEHGEKWATLGEIDALIELRILEDEKHP